MEYILKQPYTENQKNEFIVKYNHNQGLEIEFTSDSIIAHSHIETEEELLTRLRNQREVECFSVINRGQLWYLNLTDEQLTELQTWYKEWLDVTETKVVPTKPEWIK